MKQGYFNTADSAHLYYEVRGTGRPLVLIHGWQCSHLFWQRNVDELARDFTVVTLDLRGHGNSSKGLHGITIKQFACDVYDLINYLDLKDAVVMGWSMGGPIVLSYFDQFGQEQIKGLGLIDMTPFPFSPEPWNTQGLHGYNMDGFNVIAQRLAYDREAYFETFANNIFKDGKRPAGTDWVIEEFRKLPPWISAAIYSDYLSSDFTGVLPTIDVPVIVMNADGPVFTAGIKQGQHIAAQLPYGQFEAFTESGHMLFYEEAAKFNALVRDFVTKCNA